MPARRAAAAANGGRVGRYGRPEPGEHIDAEIVHGYRGIAEHCDTGARYRAEREIAAISRQRAVVPHPLAIDHPAEPVSDG